jgi:hypothetical protein
MPRNDNMRDRLGENANINHQTSLDLFKGVSLLAAYPWGWMALSRELNKIKVSLLGMYQILNPILEACRRPTAHMKDALLPAFKSPDVQKD